MPGNVGQLVTLWEPQGQGLEERGLVLRTQYHKVRFHRQSRTLKAAPVRGGGARESDCTWMKDGGRKSTMCRGLETGRTESSKRGPTKILGQRLCRHPWFCWSLYGTLSTPLPSSSPHLPPDLALWELWGLMQHPLPAPVPLPSTQLLGGKLHSGMKDACSEALSPSSRTLPILELPGRAERE